ncbi:DUF6965 family protein [Pedobacter aquatilis]|uniref:DUF6965 family protein n=1 Tax=Pedobacter aquatilis TaxID=351343 RepID=UPI00292E435D|nr:hypothetical protein [Pedobacter aquatilis]
MTINELEEWFTNAPKPDMPVYLNAATKVNDYDHFLKSHFGPLKANPVSKVNQPLLWRLQQMKLVIESNS